MTESIIENMEGSLPTPVNSNTLKENMLMSISIYSCAVMPYPSTPGTPFFDGSNVTNFFNQYSRMCTNYRVDK